MVVNLPQRISFSSSEGIAKIILGCIVNKFCFILGRWGVEEFVAIVVNYTSDVVYPLDVELILLMTNSIG